MREDTTAEKVAGARSQVSFEVLGHGVKQTCMFTCVHVCVMCICVSGVCVCYTCVSVLTPHTRGERSKGGTIDEGLC